MSELNTSDPSVHQQGLNTSDESAHNGNTLQPIVGYQPLFDLMYEEHGLMLLESELQEIIRLVEGLKPNAGVDRQEEG